MKGALTRLQAKSDKLPDSMAAERLMDSRVSSLPDEYNKHVTVLLTMAEETLGWHAFNLSLNQAEAEHAIATMSMMRSRVAAAKLEMASESRRIGKLLTNQAVQHEAQRKLECALLDGWGVTAGWQALFRSVKALGVAPSPLNTCEHNGWNPDFEHPLLSGPVCWHLAGGQQPRGGPGSFCDMVSSLQTSITSAVTELEQTVRADANGLSAGPLSPLDGAARQYWDSNAWVPDEFVTAGWLPEGRRS